MSKLSGLLGTEGELSGLKGISGVGVGGLDSYFKSRTTLRFGLTTRFTSNLVVNFLSRSFNSINSLDDYLCTCQTANSSLVVLLPVLDQVISVYRGQLSEGTEGPRGGGPGSNSLEGAGKGRL